MRRSSGLCIASFTRGPVSRDCGALCGLRAISSILLLLLALNLRFKHHPVVGQVQIEVESGLIA